MTRIIEKIKKTFGIDSPEVSAAQRIQGMDSIIEEDKDALINQILQSPKEDVEEVDITPVTDEEEEISDTEEMKEEKVKRRYQTKEEILSPFKIRQVFTLEGLFMKEPFRYFPKGTGKMLESRGGKDCTFTFDEAEGASLMYKEITDMHIPDLKIYKRDDNTIILNWSKAWEDGVFIRIINK